VISLLWRAQEQEGWVTRPAIESVAAMLGMPVIRVLEVATFYTMFHLEPVGRKAHVQVCGTTPCMLRGARDLVEVCTRRISPHQHEVSGDGDFSWEEVECLGACVNAPMVQIFRDTYEDLTPDSFEAILDAFTRGERPTPGTQIDRQNAAPVTGLTTLTDIEYADDDVPGPPPWMGDDGRRGSKGSHSAGVKVGADEPQPAADGNVGGETLEAEQQRRKGSALKREQRGGADPAGGAAEGQEIGRVDPTGRSDEAASRAMQAGRAGQAGRAEPADRAGKGAGADKAAQPRGHADSPNDGRDS
jgi:NADH-quinone oxidoreductase subunit E